MILEPRFPAEIARDSRLQWTCSPDRGSTINLGAGVNPIRGVINHAFTDGPDIDVHFDLTQVPWPIPDKTHTRILAFHVLEHLPISRALGFFTECHRILQEDSLLIVEVPDMPRMCQEYLDGNAGIIGRTYGRYSHPGEGHLWGWDRSQLMLMSRLAGFPICITKDGTDYHSVQIPTVRLEAVK